MTYTYDQMLELVNKRVPNFTAEQKNALAISAIAILSEPKYSNFIEEPMTAVKIAIARLSR